MNQKGIRLLLVVAVLLMGNSCARKEPFDSGKWKTDTKSRYAMVLTLIKEPILIGKSRIEIEGMLGRPNQKDEDTYVYFYEDGGIFGVYFATPYLGVRFDSKSGKCDKIFTSD